LNPAWRLRGADIRVSLVGLFFALTGTLIATSIFSVGKSGIAVFYLALIIPFLGACIPRLMFRQFSLDKRTGQLVNMAVLVALALGIATCLQIIMGLQSPTSEIVHLLSRIAFIAYFIVALMYIKGPAVGSTYAWLRRLLIVVCLYGVYQLPAKLLGLPLFLDWLRNNPSFSYYDFDSAGWIGMMRATSIFAEPSQATIPIIVLFILNKWSRSGSLSRWTGWTTLILFTLLTFSRTAWFTLIACYITASVVQMRKSGRKLRLEKSAIYITIVILSFTLPAWAYLKYGRHEDMSAEIRSESIIVGLRVIERHPLIGTGWKSLSTVAPRYDMDLPGAFNVDFVHNMILSYMQQIGIAGFILALFPFIAMVGWSRAPLWVTYSTVFSFLLAAEVGGDIGYSSLMWLWIALLVNSDDSSNLRSYRARQESSRLLPGHPGTEAINSADSWI
jgi:hypothetical protein